jgi:putative ABC transport system permease protein
VFTVLSIAVAFLLFGLLQGVNAWFSGLATNAHADRLIVVSRISQVEPLPVAHLQKIEQLAGIRRATYVGVFSGVYQSRGNDVLVYATDAEAFFDIYPEWRTAPDQLRALAVTRTGAIVGDVLMKAYGWKLGDRIPLATVGGQAGWKLCVGSGNRGHLRRQGFAVGGQSRDHQLRLL